MCRSVVRSFVMQKGEKKKVVSPSQSLPPPFLASRRLSIREQRSERSSSAIQFRRRINTDSSISSIHPSSLFLSFTPPLLTKRREGRIPAYTKADERGDSPLAGKSLIQILSRTVQSFTRPATHNKSRGGLESKGGHTRHSFFFPILSLLSLSQSSKQKASREGSIHRMELKTTR